MTAMPNPEDESFRMKLLACARVFKRSWIDMASSLVTVRNRGLYRHWGHETLEGYALEELNIKRATCEKLTGSYSALEQHAPQVLSWDGVAQTVPEMDAVDYFARVVDPRPKRAGEPAPAAPPAEVVEQLKQATFLDQANTAALKRRFNPVINPKDEADEKLEMLRKLKASTTRIETLLSGVDGLEESRVDEVTRCMEALRQDIEKLEEHS
jgi:hypothetical protein